jgi:glutamine kinase
MSATVPLGTKGRSLAWLQGRLASATVLPLVLIEHQAWTDDRDGELQRVLAEPWAGDAAVIVRSSAVVEGASEAGHYLTVPRVRGAAALAAAVDRVFASYGAAGAGDEVLVQPELGDVTSAGVGTTHDAMTGAPYAVVSWADNTNTVTSGGKGDVQTWRGAAYRPWGKEGPGPVPGVVALLAELQEETGHGALAVEWAVTRRGGLVLLQVSPLAVGEQLDVGTHAALLRDVEGALLASFTRPGLGTRHGCGVMPDWNPAELLGPRPRPLARALFKCLITDVAWARGRSRYGYRGVDGPLLVDLEGLLYVDVRASATSLTPQDLPEDVAARFVEAWVEELQSKPHLHDKVESTIFVPSLGLRTPGRVEEQRELGFGGEDVDQLRTALARLTSRMVDGPTWSADLARVEQVAGLASDRDDGPGLLARLTVCRDDGAVPFAGLARCAFTGREMLEDLVHEGVLSVDERVAFIAGLDLVSGQLRRDVQELSADEVLARYGHLRPGTWDIRAARYDEDPETYLGAPPAADRAVAPPAAFAASVAQLDRIATLLEERGLTTTAPRLLTFVAASLRGRERAKFLLSRVLSDVLRDLARLGERLGLSRDDLSYVGDVRVLGELTGAPAQDRAVLEAAIAAGREQHERMRWIELPPVLWSAREIWAFTLPVLQPTFVTDGRVQARLARVDEGESPDGCIALIEAADPGYDWVLTRDVRGLITAWGGVNSHMAVRAIESGLPAAIGVGLARFRELAKADVVELDAGARTVAVVA